MKVGVRLALMVAVAATSLTCATDLLAPRLAHAGPGGELIVDKKDLADDGGWRLKLTLKLPAPPASKYLTLKFIFKPKVIYETYVDDSSPDEKTREIKQDDNVTALIENFDVSFASTTGQIFNQTKFEVVLKRSRDFQAGTYRVEARDSDGNTFGKPFDLKLGGKNPTVNRKSMQFTTADQKKTAAPTKDSGGSSGAPAADPNKDKIEKTEYDEPEEKKTTVAPMWPKEIKEKPGGCGCEMPGRTSSSAPAVLASVVALGLVGSRLRRRKQK